MRIIAPLLLLSACAYEAPLNDYAAPADNVLAGEVVFAGASEPSYSVLFVTPADDPMPPYGTGRPATFTTVAASDFVVGDQVSMPSAGWTATHVPDGSYLITGFMDMDADFHPTLFGGALAGATCGDWVGAHLAGIGEDEMVPSPVTAAGGELVDGITVLLASELSTERPAFAIEGGVGVVSRRDALDDPTTLQTFTLNSTGVHVAWSGSDGGTVEHHLEGPFDGTDPCMSAFLVHVMDADGDGQPDEHLDFPGTGLLDIWPQIGLTYLGEPEDTDDDRIPDSFYSTLEEGESWTALAVPHPLPVMMGEWPVGTPTLATSLEVVWVPGALHTLADGSERTETVPTQLPAGAWAITVIEETGQTWTLPNALATLPSTDSSFEPTTQWGWLQVE